MATSTVTRLSGGDQIKIITGAISGIGPAGPVGPTGPVGPDGPVGPQGVVGPMGQIDDFYTKASNVGSPQSVASDTSSLLAFTTVVNDDASLAVSSTNFALPIGLWDIHAYVKFNKPTSTNGSGYRRCEVYYNNVKVEGVTHNAVASTDTELSVTSFVDVTQAGLILTVRVQHSQTVAINVEGLVVISKKGPGAPGPAGPQGPAGPVGQTGPTGPQGPAGSLVNNTTTFESIGG